MFSIQFFNFFPPPPPQSPLTLICFEFSLSSFNIFHFAKQRCFVVLKDTYWMKVNERITLKK